MSSINQFIRHSLAVALLGAITSAQAFVVVADLDGDRLHDEEADVFAGTTISVGVYASMTPAEINSNGGLTGFGLFMNTDGLALTGNSADAIEVSPAWDFVTQQDLLDAAVAEARVVGNTLTPGGFPNEQVRLFDISLEVPNTVGAEFTLDFADAENASFVSSEGFVYDDLAVFLTTQLNVVPIPDSDGDGVNDLQDNCTLAPNPAQTDADGDGIGNICDADLNQDCAVNFEDLGILRTRFFSNDPVADFDNSGTVNFIDLGVMRLLFFSTPGPSGQPNLCSGP